MRRVASFSVREIKPSTLSPENEVVDTLVALIKSKGKWPAGPS
jgi:hypothetical protein